MPRYRVMYTALTYGHGIVKAKDEDEAWQGGGEIVRDVPDRDWLLNMVEMQVTEVEPAPDLRRGPRRMCAACMRRGLPGMHKDGETCRYCGAHDRGV